MKNKFKRMIPLFFIFMLFCMTISTKAYVVDVDAKPAPSKKPKITDFVFEEEGKILKTGDVLHVHFTLTNMNPSNMYLIFSADPINSEISDIISIKMENNGNGEYIGQSKPLSNNKAEVRYIAKRFLDSLRLAFDRDYYFTFSNACAAGNHDYASTYTTEKEPTLFAKGSESQQCKVCGTPKPGTKRSIPKLKGSVKLSVDSLPLTEKKSSTLNIESFSDGDEILKWTSSKPSIASVNAKGKVTAKKAGTTTIVLTMKSGAKAKCRVTVTVPVTKTTKLSFTKKTVTIKKGKSETLKFKRTPAKANDKLTWKSSNTKIATVNSKGKVTAKKKGTVYVTVKAGKVSTRCKVVVK